MEEWMLEASEIMERARNLSKEEKIAFKYFMECISVGDIRAFSDLLRKGIKRPEEVVSSLLDKRLIERGFNCFNIPYPLRIYILRKGVPNLD
ncbi:MAG: hypothetical protein F7B11_04120 [Caldisphaeraceae archaeon]|nr:hypothetical protein [Caldisphaeraceae archaeon]MEB3692561.1 hypothetical protein [Caldisphaeraceae archaeon]MEB3797739.1 hypothetical protein [Caldisphaeraceae archaeon]